MAVRILVGIISVFDQAANVTNELESAGLAIGATLGIGMLVGMWFLVMIAALLIGVFLRKSSVVEEGPTGNLLEQ